VSNQSFAEPTIPITVTIDGKTVVSESFKVESQHNWIAFDLSLPAGNHEIIATSPNGTAMTKTITVADAPRWLVVNYWYSPEETRHFDLTESDKPVAFA
jgi:hypothetical protein